MPTSVPVAARLDGPMLRNAGLLAQARKSIVLAQKSDDRAAFTRFADDGGGNTCDALSDAKPLVTQFRGRQR